MVERGLPRVTPEDRFRVMEIEKKDREDGKVCPHNEEEKDEKGVELQNEIKRLRAIIEEGSLRRCNFYIAKVEKLQKQRGERAVEYSELLKLSVSQQKQLAGIRDICDGYMGVETETVKCIRAILAALDTGGDK